MLSEGTMSFCLSKIKLVTFDVTNTLLKFKLPVSQYYAMVAQDYGFKGTQEDVKTKFKKSFNYMCEQHPNFGKKSIKWENWWCRVVTMTLKDNLPSSANFDAIAHKLIDEFKTDRCWECADGGHKLIDHFKSLGIAVGVISNFDPRLNEILQNVSLHKHFDFIVTSYETGYSKPDERIFKSAIDKCISSSVTPSEALHIGDDVVKDYEGARMAGWHALLVNPKTQQSKASQKHIFKNLNELSSAIEQKTLKL